MPPPPIPKSLPKPGKPVAALVGLILLGLLILVVAGRRGDQPAGDKPAAGGGPAARPGGIPGGIQVHQAGQPAPAKVLPRYAPDWTHRELIAYLEAKGVKLEAVPAIAPKSMFFFPPDSKGAADLIRTCEDNPGAADLFSATGVLRNAGIILVTLYPTEQEAREQAALGSASFAWHRFAFFGAVGNLKRYRDALN